MRAPLTRTLLGTFLTVALATSVGLPPQGSRAKASGPSLILDEINWAGSAVSASDQWVELYNPGQSMINFGLTPYHLVVNGSNQVNLSSGAILPGGYYLVARNSGSQTALQIQPDYVSSALSLPTANASYQLTDQDGAVVDRADDGSGAPLGGFAGSSTALKASMIRTSLMADGTAAVAWSTSHTVGNGLKGDLQFGTPQNSSSFGSASRTNPEIAQPSDLSVAPASPATMGTSPVISGKVVAMAGETAAATALVTYQLIGGSAQTMATPISQADGSFSQTLPQLAAGLYHIWVSVQDVYGNHSAALPVQIPGSPQNVYVVNETLSVVAPPTLGSYPALTNQPSLTLTGTVQPGATLVVSINGQEAKQQALAANQTAFSLTVSLIPNSVNKIEVRARTANGDSSDPAVATVTHDSLAPALQASLVTLASNPAGSQDSVSGAAGSSEAGATVEAYADKEMIQKIGFVTVNADGSFGPLNIGDNQYAGVYVVAKDAAGNSSQVLALNNPIGFANSPVTVGYSFSAVGDDRATLTIRPLLGAVNYRLKYKKAGGSYSAPIDLCTGASSCDLSRVMVNLAPGTQYVFAIAAVDRFGVETQYAEQSLTTTGTAAVQAANGIGGSSDMAPLTVASQATSSQAASSSSNVGSSVATTGSGSSSSAGATTQTPEATASPSPSPTASPETGEVQSAEDNGTGRNYTPWIILAILLALAILATTGYFYWFGGEAGEGVDEAVTAKESRDVAAGQTQDRVTKVEKPKDPPPTGKTDPADTGEAKKPNDREKRW